MILLKKFDASSDLKRLISWVDTARLNIIWASDKFGFPLEEKKMKAYFESTAQNGTLVFKVIHQEKENSVVIGHAEIDINGKEIKISRLLIAKAHRGKGFGQKMITALILYIQNNLEYEDICLTVFTFNKAVKLYEKMGFEKVEIDKGFMSYEGASWNRLTMKLQVQ